MRGTTRIMEHLGEVEGKEIRSPKEEEQEGLLPKKT
jgi:hypothetical protein